MGRKNKHRKGNGGNESNWSNFSFDSDEEESYLKTQTLKLRPFSPRTDSQKEAYEIVKENTLTFLGGEAGTGKSILLCRVALEYLEKGLVKKIIVTRPSVEVGQSLGFMPGDEKSKMSHYLAPLYDNFEIFLTPEKLKQLMEEEVIKVVPVQFMRGRTFNNSFIIIDEGQNLTKSEAYACLTRIGFDSYCGMTYDEKQIDLKGPKKDDSFVWDLDRFEGGKDIGFFEFGPEDIVRSPIVKEIVRLYQDSGDN